MKKTVFSLQRSDLESVLSSMQPICAKKTAINATNSVLFHVSPGELVIRATDLEVSLQASCSVVQAPDKDITFLVHARRLFDLIRELDGVLEFSWDGKAISIKAEGSTGKLGIRLSTAAPDDFPPFPERIENLMELDSDFLRKVLDRLVNLVPSNNANPALNGLFTSCDKDGLSMVATDGHSLAQIKTADYQMSEPQSWIIPKRSLVEFKKTLDSSETKKVFLGTCNGLLVFSGGNFNFFTRLVADKFPHYQPILARDGFFRGATKIQPLSAALRRAGCLLAGKFVSTNFTINEQGRMKVSLKNKEIGSMEEEIESETYKGDDIKSAFYSPYVLSALHSIGGDKVDYLVKGGSSPIFFEKDEPNCKLLYLVMPVLENQAEK